MQRNFFNNNVINKTIKSRLDNAISDYTQGDYAYVVMNKDNPTDIAILSNKVAWFDIYLNSQYQFIDPVIKRALTRVEDFFWDEKMICSSLSPTDESNIFQVAKQYDIKKGHTFVVHDYKNNLVVLSVFENQDLRRFKRNILTHREKIQLLITQTQQEMLSLYKDEDGHQFATKPILSVRENAVLYWASCGKTTSEIGTILGIKPSTVKFHNQNIIFKLGVANTKHAINRAVEMQLIKAPFRP